MTEQNRPARFRDRVNNTLRREGAPSTVGMWFYKLDGRVFHPIEDAKIVAAFQHLEVPPELKIIMKGSGDNWDISEAIDGDGNLIDLKPEDVKTYLAGREGMLTESIVLFDKGRPDLLIKPLHGEWPDEWRPKAEPAIEL